jgi:DNA-binding protein HU-beta
VNRSELIDSVAASANIPKNTAAKVIDAVLDGVTQALKKGDEVRLPGFGSFAVSERAAREGRDPRTGKTIKIAASKTPKFKPGKGLKDAVNG